MKHTFNERKLVIIPMVLIGIAVFGAVVMYLWNHVLAIVLNIHTIDFWQALGIFILSKILFSSFRGGHWGRHQLTGRMLHRWEKMTPEQREKFKQEWQNRCGRRFGRDFDKEFKEQQPPSPQP